MDTILQKLDGMLLTDAVAAHHPVGDIAADLTDAASPAIVGRQDECSAFVSMERATPEMLVPSLGQGYSGGFDQPEKADVFAKVLERIGGRKTHTSGVPESVGKGKLTELENGKIAELF